MHDLVSNVTAASSSSPSPSIDLGPGPAGITQLQDLITRMINLSVGAAFILVTVVLVVIALRYLTSGGEPKALGQAHDAVTWALLGIVFMVLAWLTLLLVQSFTGVEVTQFNLCTLFPKGLCPTPSPVVR